jgi:hypothetical protein
MSPHENNYALIIFSDFLTRTRKKFASSATDSKTAYVVSIRRKFETKHFSLWTLNIEIVDIVTRLFQTLKHNAGLNESNVETYQ